MIDRPHFHRTHTRAGLIAQRSEAKQALFYPSTASLTCAWLDTTAIRKLSVRPVIVGSRSSQQILYLLLSWNNKPI